MESFSLKMAAILMVIFVYGPAFGYCVTIDIKCNEAECKGICQKYGDKLEKSYCKELPHGLGNLCVCLRNDGSTTMSAMVANKVVEN